MKSAENSHAKTSARWTLLDIEDQKTCGEGRSETIWFDSYCGSMQLDHWSETQLRPRPPISKTMFELHWSLISTLLLDPKWSGTRPAENVLIKSCASMNKETFRKETEYIISQLLLWVLQCSFCWHILHVSPLNKTSTHTRIRTICTHIYYIYIYTYIHIICIAYLYV